MAEEKWRGNASKVMDELMQNPLTQEEQAARYLGVPELRLRADTPTVDVDETTRVQGVLARLHGEDTRSLALRDRGAAISAVVIPVERYLELVGIQLAKDPSIQRDTSTGSIAPTGTALAASHVEQVHPRDTWTVM
jgi:hypothetical protein